MAEDVPRLRVWVMQPSGSASAGWTFAWDWGSWHVEPRLIPLSWSRQISSKGSATFRLLRKERREPWHRRMRRFDDQVVVGAYIAITAESAGTDLITDPDEPGRQILDPARILWWGTISELDGSRVAIDDDAIGSVSALEIGHLLDASIVSGFSRHDGASGYPDPIQSPPTANLQGRGGEIIGNAQAGTTDDGVAVYHFARTLEDCGTTPARYWTRWRLLEQVELVAVPKALPTLSMAPGSGVESYLDDTSAPEVYGVQGHTYAGFFDYLLPLEHGLVWWVTPEQDQWKIQIRAINLDGDFGLPTTTPTNLDFDNDDTLTGYSLGESDVDQPDEIIVLGHPVRFGVTVSPIDDGLEPAWTDAEQSAYELADPLERAQAQHEDVFTLYRLKPVANGDVRISEEPGDGASNLPVCPGVQWDGSTLQLNRTSYVPYLPSAQLESIVPWPVGLGADGTDNRDDKAKAAPTYHRLRVYHYDIAAAAADQCVELTADNSLVSERPQVEVDDRAAGVRITYSAPHIIADGHIINGSFDDDGSPPALDYEKILVTCGIESDQRVRIVARRKVGGAEIGAGDVRRQLVVHGDWHCWVTLKGTVLGVDDDSGTTKPKRVSVTNEPLGLGYVVRSDFPAAQRALDRLAAWAFRQARPTRITTVTPHDPPAWAELGTVIGTITDGEASLTANAVVLGTQARLDPDGLVTLQVIGDPPPRPALGGGGAGGVSASPTGGGRVSAGLGGTVASRVQVQQRETARIREHAARRIIHPPFGGAPQVVTVLTNATGTDTLFSSPSIKGIAIPPTPISSVPTANPNDVATFPEGLGKATLNNKQVYITSWLTDSEGTNHSDLITIIPNTLAVIVRLSYDLPVDDDASATATVYLVYRL